MNTDVLAIDPGHTKSAFVVLSETGRVVRRDTMLNTDLCNMLWYGSAYHGPGGAVDLPRECAVEMVASYGMAVGREVFETVLLIGRLVEMLEQTCGRRVQLVYRRDVKLTLCGVANAKDANIRQALIDLYGGSKEAAIGRKKTPGPLYGMKGDEWAALAVGVAWMRGRFGATWEPRVASEVTP